jgi:hypothetical protein
MPTVVTGILHRIRSITGEIDLALFDRGFYSKDLMISLQSMEIPYLIFVPKNDSVKRELESMNYGEKRITQHEFSFYRDGRKITGILI